MCQFDLEVLSWLQNKRLFGLVGARDAEFARKLREREKPRH